MKRLLFFPVLVAAIEVTSIVSVAVGMAIYPGVFNLTAPVLCPHDQPDSFVVQYNVQTSEGTGTNFTVFCMNDRGEFTEVGSWRPIGLLFAYVNAGLLVCVLLPVAVIVLWIRRSGRGGSPGDALVVSDAPPITPPSYIGRL